MKTHLVPMAEGWGEPVFVEGLGCVTAIGSGSGSGASTSTSTSWIKYGNYRGKVFSEDQDIFLLFMMYKYQYNGFTFQYAHPNPNPHTSAHPTSGGTSSSTSSGGSGPCTGTGTVCCWERIRMEIRLHSSFRFDWFFKSRSSSELTKRCEVLLKVLEREHTHAHTQAAH